MILPFINPPITPWKRRAAACRVPSASGFLPAAANCPSTFRLPPFAKRRGSSLCGQRVVPEGFLRPLFRPTFGPARAFHRRVREGAPPPPPQTAGQRTAVGALRPSLRPVVSRRTGAGVPSSPNPRSHGCGAAVSGRAPSPCDRTDTPWVCGLCAVVAFLLAAPADLATRPSACASTVEELVRRVVGRRVASATIQTAQGSECVGGVALHSYLGGPRCSGLCLPFRSSAASASRGQEQAPCECHNDHTRLQFHGDKCEASAGEALQCHSS
ncbi:hypothetical protein TraAM80_10549, partial [Trypanosoma rangeli]